MKQWNSAAMTGFLLCLTALVFGIATNGGISSILHLLHLPSMIVTFGGALCAVLITADSFGDFVSGLKSFARAFQKPGTDPRALAEEILALSDLARKEGLLILEERSGEISDGFLRKGIALMVDGTEGTLVRDILEAETLTAEEVGRRQVRFWQDLGSYGPAWGMIGTLLGLIDMMRSMGDDPSAVGSGMSLALLTTLYGSVLANWICIPLARKLEKRTDAETLGREVCVEGILSIQAGENPRVIREKLEAVLEGGKDPA